MKMLERLLKEGRYAQNTSNQALCLNCGTKQADDSQFCRKCGFRLAPTPTPSTTSETHPAITSESNQQNSADVPQPCLPAAVSDEKGNSRLNLGTIVFAFFSVLSLVVGMAKGIPPISLAETCVWAAAAIYWHRRSISSPKANLIVLLLAVCVAAGEGYSLGQSGSPNYTYLKEGNIQFRVDADRGRTDMLSAGGWTPVSFDRPPQAIPSDQIPRLVLVTGGLESGTSTTLTKMCFDVQNNSDYVLKDVTILAAMHGSASPSASPYPAPPGIEPSYKPGPERVVLQSAYLVDSGTSAHLCGTTFLDPSDIWISEPSVTSATGWNR